MSDEAGWLIEVERAASPTWWAGGTSWTTDNQRAVRFARKIDAERVAETLTDGLPKIATEHLWCAPPPTYKHDGGTEYCDNEDCQACHHA